MIKTRIEENKKYFVTSQRDGVFEHTYPVQQGKKNMVPRDHVLFQGN